jgi:hypothetical protein
MGVRLLSAACRRADQDGHSSSRYYPPTRSWTYAGDLVILCWKGKAEAALQRLREIMSSSSQCHRAHVAIGVARRAHSDIPCAAEGWHAIPDGPSRP